MGVAVVISCCGRLSVDVENIVTVDDDDVDDANVDTVSGDVDIDDVCVAKDYILLMIVSMIPLVVL